MAEIEGVRMKPGINAKAVLVGWGNMVTEREILCTSYYIIRQAYYPF